MQHVAGWWELAGGTREPRALFLRTTAVILDKHAVWRCTWDHRPMARRRRWARRPSLCTRESVEDVLPRKTSSKFKPEEGSSELVRRPPIHHHA